MIAIAGLLRKSKTEKTVAQKIVTQELVEQKEGQLPVRLCSKNHSLPLF